MCVCAPAVQTRNGTPDHYVDHCLFQTIPEGRVWIMFEGLISMVTICFNLTLHTLGPELVLTQRSQQHAFSLA